MKCSFRLLTFTIAVFTTCQNYLFGQEYLEFRKNEVFIEYPSHFTLDTSGVEGAIFVLSTQKSNSDDLFVENINLVAQPSNESFDAFLKKTEAQISEVAEIVENEMVSGNGKDYKRLVFKLQSNGFGLTIIQHIFDYSGKVYALTFSGETAELDKYVGVVNKVFNSFKLG